MRFAKVATLGFVAFIAVACSGISIPSIPPIVIPTLPPGSSSIPTLPPGVIPSASGTCAYITVEEMGTIMGGSATLTGTSDGDCTFTMSSFATIAITIENGTDLASSKIAFGQSAKDITVAGLPAVSGSLIIVNQPGVHVQKGANQLQVQGVLIPNDDATIAKLVQVATLAVSRWPG